MNIFKNIKIFSSFGNTIKALSVITNVIRGLAFLFLIGQIIMIFKDAKNDRLNSEILGLDEI